MSEEVRDDLTSSFQLARRGRTSYPRRTGEDWFFLGFMSFSAFLHFAFIMIQDFTFFSEPAPLLEEWSMDAEIVSDIEISAPDKSALPDADKKDEAKAPENMLPQLTKKFALKDTGEEEEMPGEDLKDPEKELKKVEKKIEKKKEEKINLRSDKDEQNKLSKKDLIRRLALEKLRNQKKLAKKAEAEEKSDIAKLQAELAKKDLFNKGNTSGKLSGKAQKYGTQLITVITNNYTLPSVYNYKGQSLKVGIGLVITERGELRSLEVSQGSGESAFDQFVLDAIKAGTPFPPPPKELANKSIIINFTPGSF